MIRKLARIVRIKSVNPIQEAALIEVAQVEGWKVVVKKGEFSADNLAVYFEIDSFLPRGNSAWQFLVDKSCVEYNNTSGHVLRTVRLKGQVSQGLLLPVSSFEHLVSVKDLPERVVSELSASEEVRFCDVTWAVGDEVTRYLNVIKWEAPIPADLQGIARGMYLSGVPRTDQERIQNLTDELQEWQAELAEWEITEKLEGDSTTFAWLSQEVHVCSRGVDYLESEESPLWWVANALSLKEVMPRVLGGRNIAVQGELVGPGIQKNYYGLQEHRFFAFAVYDVDKGEYLLPSERHALIEALGLDHVPVVSSCFVTSAETDSTALLAMADGPSAIAPGKRREGLTLKSRKNQDSFKVVSDKYLLGMKL